MKVWFNGRIENAEKPLVPLTDVGLLYGHGLFETLFIYDGRPILWEEHIARMIKSTREFQMDILFDRNTLLQGALDLIQANSIKYGSIRITVLGSGNIFMTCKQGKPYDDNLYKEGVSLTIIKEKKVYSEGWLINHKTTSYMEKLLIKKRQVTAGFVDAILLNEKGNVAECCVSNIFCIKDAVIYTPPVSAGILPGVVRALVCELLQNANFKIKEMDFTPEFLVNSQEVFLTNSLMGIMPVKNIDNSFFPIPSKFTEKIMEMYKKHLF